MHFSAGKLFISAKDAAAKQAAEILRAELRFRRFSEAAAAHEKAEKTIELASGAVFDSDDCFEIAAAEYGLVFRANGIRGLIYAVGIFLRKTEVCGGQLVFSDDAVGFYRPEKPVRGHQLGYRPCSNTSDAWDVPQFERYMTELMYFGMNTVELIPFTEQNGLMRYDGVTMTALLSEKAHALGLNVS